MSQPISQMSIKTSMWQIVDLKLKLLFPFLDVPLLKGAEMSSFEMSGDEFKSSSLRTLILWLATIESSKIQANEWQTNSFAIF